MQVSPLAHCADVVHVVMLPKAPPSRAEQPEDGTQAAVARGRRPVAASAAAEEPQDRAEPTGARVHAQRAQDAPRSLPPLLLAPLLPAPVLAPLLPPAPLLLDAPPPSSVRDGSAAVAVFVQGARFVGQTTAASGGECHRQRRKS